MSATSSSNTLDNKHRVFAIIGASSGNLVEWFDFYVYSFCSIYFAPLFFPSGDATSQLLKTAGVFAAGFLMRPIGGWVFGRIADRYGRRNSMMISVIVMCGGSLLIACLPTYAMIGAAAPALLLLARLMQGLSVGGEYGTSATYMSEVAQAGRRGFYASFQYVTLIGGQLVAVLVLVILQHVLTVEQLKEWGWRIPFVMGAMAAVVVLYLRKSLAETVTNESRQNKEAGTLKGLMKHKSAFLTVIGFTAGGSLTFYTFTTYMQKYLVNTVGIAAESANVIMTCALFLFMVLQPLFGAMADRIGTRTNLLWFAGLTTLFTVPLMLTLKGMSNPYGAFGLIMMALLAMSFYTSVTGLVKAELFPPEVRALGVGLSYAIGNALFGGSAEYVALWLKSIGMESSFYWYVAALSLVAWVVVYRMKDTRTSGYLERS